jgi:hypothetical protein
LQVYLTTSSIHATRQSGTFEKAAMTKLNPKVRRAGLLLEELPTELLVYDQRSHHAHCLNAPAASVFRSADGSLSVAEIAEAASVHLGTPFSEDLTWMALQELDKNGLLETSLPLVPQGPSRRQILGAGAAAVLLPLVMVMTAPTPAYAQSGATGATGINGGSSIPTPF